MRTKHFIPLLLAATACGGGGGGTAGDDSPNPDAGIPTKKAKKVVVGNGTTYALTTDGELRAWGYSENLGFGQDSNELVPRTLIASGVVDVSTRYQTTCVALSDGTVKCWGDNRSGTVGDGTDTTRPLPTTVPGVTGATSVAVGDDTACAITASNVMCWGSNEAHALNAETPDPNNTNMPVPSLVPLAVTGLSGIPKRISFGSHHACAIMATNHLECWGQNTWGQLGIGVDGGSRPDPFGTVVPEVVGLTNVVDVAAYDTHTVAVLSTGAVKSWGAQEDGALGNGIYSAAANVNTPGDVNLLQAGGTAVSGYCAITSGTVHCWNHFRGGGRDEDPVISATPTTVPNISNAVQISNDSQHTCLMRATGGVTCWGDNTNGQLGIGIDGPSDDLDVRSPQDVPSFGS